MDPLEHRQPIQDAGGSSLWDEFKPTVILWLLAAGGLWLNRWLLLFIFRTNVAPSTTVVEYLRAARRGFCFDASVASYAVVPAFVASVIAIWMGHRRWHDQVRRWTARACWGVLCILGSINIAFVGEYREQFNHWIFGLIYDDRTATFKTIWADYPLVWLILLWAVFLGVGEWLLRRTFPLRNDASPDDHRRPLGSALVVSGVAIGMLVFGLRGSLGRRPIQIRDAAVTSDAFINNLVPNFVSALRYAIHDHYQLQGSGGLSLWWPDLNIQSAARTAFPAVQVTNNLDALLEHTAPGPMAAPPRHFFLIVMESYEAWPLLPKYEPLGLTPELKRLANEGNWVTNFTSAGPGTIESLGSLITGIPEAGVKVSYQPSARRPYPTSIAPIFTRLGYRTRLFYGGFLSWERLGSFAKDQGFDEVVGGGTMARPGTTREWGADDEELFRFIAQTVTDERPSFNLIMSTSYHPPYPLDVANLGFPLQKMPAAFESQYDARVPLRVWGHLWYADKWLGWFEREMDAKVPGCLFAVTGDHTSRRFLNGHPNLFEATAVPLVLCGKGWNAIGKQPSPAGSHLDILPTFVELAAPNGFRYHCFGRNLLNTPTGDQAGFGRVITTPEGVFSAQGQSQSFVWPGDFTQLASSRVAELRQRHAAIHALGWWRIMKGAELSSPKEKGASIQSAFRGH